MASINKYWALYGALCSSALSQVLFKPVNDFQPLAGQTPSITLDIDTLFNNRGFGTVSGDGNFDGSGGKIGYLITLSESGPDWYTFMIGAYPAVDIPPSSFVYNGINFSFPNYNATGNDNIVVLGQTVNVPKGRYLSLEMLAASESGMQSGPVTATYSDGTTSTGYVLVPPWWSWPYPEGGDLVFPYRITDVGVDYNRTNIFQTTNWLDSSKDLISLTLPDLGTGVGSRMHVFSMSLTPISSSPVPGPNLEIHFARSTKKWVDKSDKTQIIEVVVNNVGSDFVLSNNSVSLTVESPGLHTVQEGLIKRLRPGDQVTVDIGVVNKPGIKPGSTGNATIVLSGHDVKSHRYTFNATYGIGTYEPTYESVYSHESPNWFNNAKYGIFIHWGVYSVPGWGNTGNKESYAEWYWWALNQGPDSWSQTYQYHQQTYGQNVVYDNFIQNFTADAWDPKEWVDLFADAGANYFVQVSKHHDGYALFDLPANVSTRTSVAQYPYRNLLKELFDAAQKYQPHLHRAAYYSLPEWFSPAYAKYGFGSWPGGNATNPFTNETLPYTGFVDVSDYIEDIIIPQMNALAELGSEIMWCDIGGPNKTAEFASSWFNRAAQQNRQVLMNSRCGLPGDFDTPEYARYSGVQVRKWESNLGMDPFSFGYNRATPLSGYMNASAIVTSLVDIISKNGNFLLDIGPQANGTILEVEQTNLRDAGVWIKSHAEAIFNTSYWFVTPEEGQNIRFTTTPEAFYIMSLSQPNSTIVLNSPIPWVPGDKVTVVGGDQHGKIVASQQLSNGSVQFNVSQSVADADRYAWVFKITY
ncbi:uncharacterized protein BHQ10_009471 [Talaromyces amestolkiae]|uniref:alpha-L-fucosidase n=1 Tax=Talaromyces amestolkiae TaxID=1196081 RepID=A0A364LCF7_TALAM|nr:uncharacterized protein BHQ10_009471 [Talaromyces amestolkiae]RAO73459.1 hypothetical protein BHQ10_009471 [Talaromyces amestolkiae]